LARREAFRKSRYRGWGCSLIVEHLTRVARPWVPSPLKKKKKGTKKSRCSSVVEPQGGPCLSSTLSRKRKLEKAQGLEAGGLEYQGCASQCSVVTLLGGSKKEFLYVYVCSKLEGYSVVLKGLTLLSC
jgi:hypothetical protein